MSSIGLLCILLYVFIHCVCFVSIFDIYFTTTITSEVRAVPVTTKPLASRLVLFVADGLRADKFFENDIGRAPYLRGIAKGSGTWGVSLTRAPTESRPCHVAILGGFYEDPSALRALWQDNPVDFDTVFNRSRETWAWGAGDVLVYLNKGSAGSHVHIRVHNYHLSDLSKLDDWTFDQMGNFFASANKNETLRMKLSEDKLVFFLHLAGIDSNGHRSGSQARAYLDNIGVVDRGVRRTVQLFDEFYSNDDKTAYIFTADHGMTNSGGHGGSHPTELRTPLVAWGSGIKALNHNSISEFKDGEENNGIRLDQIDLSVLMTSLLGAEFPVNSRGSLPLQYLAADTCTKAELVKTRAMQLGEQYIAKLRYSKQTLFRLLFSHFEIIESSIHGRNSNLEKLIRSNQCRTAVDAGEDSFRYSSQALDNYESFRKFIICAFIMALLLSSAVIMAALALGGFQPFHSRNASGQKRRKLAMFLLLSIFFAASFLHSIESPWTYYFYFLLPLFMWCQILNRYVDKSRGAVTVTKQLIFNLLIALTVMWCIMLSFYERKFLSVGLLLLSAMPYLMPARKNRLLSTGWTIGCLLLVIFPLLRPVDTNQSRKGLVFLAGILSSFLCSWMKFGRGVNQGKYHRIFSESFRVIIFSGALLPVFAGGIVFMNSTYTTLVGKMILVGSWVVGFVGVGKPLDRLASSYSWHSASYLFLSHSFDALFFVGLTALLYLWISLETHGIGASDEVLPHKTLDHATENIGANEGASVAADLLRQSTVFIFFVILGFLGVYNIESFFKFNTRKLPFLPVTDQPTMIVLFAYKIFLHYLIIASCLFIIASKVGTSLRTYCCVAAIYFDFMFMHFLCWVKDTGSWAKMGMSIANLGIIAGLPLAIAIILAVAKALTSIKLPLCGRS